MPRYNGGFIGHDGLDAPDTPTIGTPSAGSTQADIAFTAGAAGTTATTEFVATTNDGIGATGTSSPITITGLTNGTSYTARVYAKNSHGTSAASEASASFTPLAEVISSLFDSTLWTGDGSSSRTITNNINLSGKGGLAWIKCRDTGLVNGLFDTVRGIGSSFAYRLMSDGTDAQSELADGLSAFNSNGFTLGSSTLVNGNNSEYVGWTFREQPKFFDIVQYSGNGSAQTLSHNLGSTPGMIIVKRTDSAGSWRVFHRSLGETKTLTLQATGAAVTSSVYWNDTAPTSTQFTIGTDSSDNGGTYIAYLFAHNNSDGGFGPDSEDIIKCDSYTGNGSTSGNFINVGFEPQFVLIKNRSSSANWVIFDNMRGVVTDGDDTSSGDIYLFPNSSTSEGGGIPIDFNSTGFTVYGTSARTNTNSDGYIYMAIRRPDMSTPTVASEVFAIDEENASEPYYTSNFPVDMGFLRVKNSSSSYYIYDRLRQGKELVINTTAAEGGASNGMFDYQDGFYAGTTGNGLAWMWKRARGYFDVVPYTGTGSATTVTHNLGAVPEMMWIKCRSNTDNWAVYHSGIGATKVIFLNNDIAAATLSTRFNDTAPTSSVFTVGTDNEVNGSGRTYIAYLFATVAGVSKVGSFTATGSDVNVDCGFTNGAKFVLIKRTNSSDDWFIFRDIASGDDKRLKLNNTAAEVSSDNIDPLSSGFTMTSGILGSSGNEFIFYAVANDPS